MRRGYDSHSPDTTFRTSRANSASNRPRSLEKVPGETPMTNGNGVPPEATPPPPLNVLAQYTKDLSFANPNAPASLAPQQPHPAINIQLNVSANNTSENELE